MPKVRFALAKMDVIVIEFYHFLRIRARSGIVSRSKPWHFLTAAACLFRAEKTGDVERTRMTTISVNWSFEKMDRVSHHRSRTYTRDLTMLNSRICASY